MFAKIISRVNIELSHYRALREDSRRLLISYYLYLSAYPLFGIFTNAYLWQTGENLLSLVIFNLLYCLGLPLGFYLNGILLQHFHALRMYGVGVVLQGLSGILVVFFPASTPITLALYGAIYGVGGGLYWGNKSYLTQKITRGTNRLYYLTLESSGDMLINIFMPAVAGGIISLGTHFNLYNLEIGYRLAMGLGLILTLISGLIVQGSSLQDIDHEHMFIKKKSSRWNSVRLYNYFFNLIVGVEFIIPSVLVLALVGNEGTLGLVSSITAGLSALTLYILGRKGNLAHIWRIVALGFFIYLTSGILLATGLSLITVLIYEAASTIGWALRWSPGYTITMEIMDREDDHHQYAYICDNEVFFNLGRITGISLIVILSLINQEFALRFIPLLVGAVGALALFPLNKMVQSLRYAR